MANNQELNIIHLYPDLLNLYGDRGNIACMQKRLEWRGIDAKVSTCTNSDHSINLENADIIFVGGGSDREQEIVCSLLLKKKDEITNYVENGGVLVAVCGGYQLLGKYYQTANSKIEGLGILDIYTDAGDTRLIGNVVLESELFSQKITGFENHAGRTFIGNHTRSERSCTDTETQATAVMRALCTKTSSQRICTGRCCRKIRCFAIISCHVQ